LGPEEKNSFGSLISRCAEPDQKSESVLGWYPCFYPHPLDKPHRPCSDKDCTYPKQTGLRNCRIDIPSKINNARWRNVVKHNQMGEIGVWEGPALNQRQSEKDGQRAYFGEQHNPNQSGPFDAS
jgi:hypothetical protein